MGGKEELRQDCVATSILGPEALVTTNVQTSLKKVNLTETEYFNASGVNASGATFSNALCWRSSKALLLGASRLRAQTLGNPRHACS